MEELPLQTYLQERMLGDALTSISDFIYIFDREGRFLFANQALLDLWGIGIDEAVGKNFHDLKYPDDLAARLLRQVQEVVEKRRTVRDETPYTSPVGIHGYYEYIFSPVLEANGTVRAVVGTTREITDRKLTSSALEESRRRLALATESAQIGIWDWDALADKLVWDPQMYRLYGIRGEDFGGAMDAWQMAVHPDDRGRCTAEHAAAVSGFRDFHTEFRILWPNGEVRYIEAHAVVTRAGDGSATRMIGVNWDITERRAADDRLREQAALLDLARDAIIVAGIDSQIQFWNHGAQSVYGWTSAEAIGKRATKLLYTDSSKHDLALKCLIDSGEWSGELRQVRKDGTPVFVASRWTLLADHNGSPKCMLIINSDITEHKKMESQFLRTQRMESIGTLASGVAHDLNNILAPILLSVPLLREDLSNEKRDTILCDLEASAQRGSDIVNQVLTFARGADGERLLVQPAHLVNEMVHIAEEAFPKSVKVTATYPLDPWSVEADPSQLHQVLMNLCVNARDAMPDGGELTITVENTLLDDSYAATMPGAKAGPHIVIRVRDTGRGIPHEIVDRIFDPFFTTKEVGKGTGLGLSTSIGIIKSHGGTINVYSEPGLGTTFNLYLPAITGSQAKASGEETNIIPRGNGEWLLLVDDERSIRNMAAAILENHGYQVTVAADGLEAITAFADQMERIACIITDMMMPNMDGFTLIRTLKNMNPRIIVVASTGQRDDKRMKDLNALGVPVCLNKPYNRRNLLIAVHDALARAE